MAGSLHCMVHIEDVLVQNVKNFVPISISDGSIVVAYSLVNSLVIVWKSYGVLKVYIGEICEVVFSYVWVQASGFLSKHGSTLALCDS